MKEVGTPHHFFMQSIGIHTPSNASPNSVKTLFIDVIIPRDSFTIGVMFLKTKFHKVTKLPIMRNMRVI